MAYCQTYEIKSKPLDVNDVVAYPLHLSGSCSMIFEHVHQAITLQLGVLPGFSLHSDVCFPRHLAYEVSPRHHASTSHFISSSSALSASTWLRAFLHGFKTPNFQRMAKDLEEKLYLFPLSSTREN